jgi:hypothetical protein
VRGGAGEVVKNVKRWVTRMDRDVDDHELYFNCFNYDFTDDHELCFNCFKSVSTPVSGVAANRAPHA